MNMLGQGGGGGGDGLRLSSKHRGNLIIIEKIDFLALDFRHPLKEKKQDGIQSLLKLVRTVIYSYVDGPLLEAGDTYLQTHGEG